MNYKKNSFVILGAMLSKLAFANSLSAPSFNLSDLVLPHAVTHSNQASISLQPLQNYDPNFERNISWHISCNFNIKETSGAADPSVTNPLAAIIDGNDVYAEGPNYTSKGFIAPKGNIEILASTPPPDKINFINYDLTGDLTISNCIARLQLNNQLGSVL